ncbi:MAG TPA: hypothetical protein DF613_17265 [Lachnospiraceae bacterium]|nr:hypothetical protein [Lachnospiraceae bacterium]
MICYMLTIKIRWERNMPAKRMTLSLQIQNQLQTALLNGTYEVGQYLPGEGTLAETYNVSRTTMRDAISGLVEKGFLERHQGKGVLVIDKSRNVAVGSVRNMILRENYTVAEFMEIREMIDNRAACFAASRATDKEIEKMRENIRLMEQKTINLDEYTQYDLEFHRQLAMASQNRLLIALFYAIEPLLKQILGKVIAATGMVEANCRYHAQILEQIEKRCVEGAVEKMEEHDRASKDMFKESIKNNERLEDIIIMEFDT